MDAGLMKKYCWNRSGIGEENLAEIEAGLIIRILLNESEIFYKINIIFCAELSETNSRAELSAPNCPTPHCPGTQFSWVGLRDRPIGRPPTGVDLSKMLGEQTVTTDESIWAFLNYLGHAPVERVGILSPVLDLRALCVFWLAGFIIMNIHEQRRHWSYAIVYKMPFEDAWCFCGE